MRAPILALKDVRLADGPLMLFDGVDLALDARVRACLVGRNGAGKTTLLRVLNGQTEPDGGERTVSPGTQIALVAQEPAMEGATLLEHCTAGGAPDYAAAARLQAFGLDPEKSTQGLSGGEIRRVALSRAFAEDPDVLMLDEPTNHLDILAIETLESEIAAKPGRHPDRQPRPRLPGTHHPALLLAGAPQGPRLDAGFAGFDEWVEKIMAQQAEEASPPGQAAGARTALDGARRHRPARPQRGPAPR